MLGMAPGATKSFTITYPADYIIAELASGTVDDTVTLKKIKKRVVPHGAAVGEGDRPG